MIYIIYWSLFFFTIFKSAYPSYGKDNNNIYKSTKDSSKSVDIKKIKCNNINVNLNSGLGANGNGDNGNKTNGFKKIERDGFTFICINNNNNVAAGGGGAGDGDGNGDGWIIDECDECFDDPNTLAENIRNAIVTELQAPGAVSIQNVPDLGTVVIPATVTSIDDLCRFILDFVPPGEDPPFAFNTEQLEFILTDLAGGIALPGTFTELLECLVEIGNNR